jgi:hypothetical protein
VKKVEIDVREQSAEEHILPPEEVVGGRGSAGPLNERIRNLYTSSMIRSLQNVAHLTREECIDHFGPETRWEKT